MELEGIAALITALAGALVGTWGLWTRVRSRKARDRAELDARLKVADETAISGFRALVDELQTRIRELREDVQEAEARYDRAAGELRETLQRLVEYDSDRRLFEEQRESWAAERTWLRERITHLEGEVRGLQARDRAADGAV